MVGGLSEIHKYSCLSTPSDHCVLKTLEIEIMYHKLVMCFRDHIVTAKIFDVDKNIRLITFDASRNHVS